ncbi:stage V sporulation protein B [Alicyclobacillus fastidiosus]|uniref:Stage V sporulation protein B n=1 Tax=Alicyclobacillus fastidiosus TaxID=392011 RepID=A0ABV5AD34_9BACL|nr:stage V sporulation protein B [Alicyclobacillus fastidiosus]WEH11210.1 stage V sporulation protein B [Alicyclobacillus fastidiosus]
MNRPSFLHGALILMISGLVTRIMGFVYRVFLTRIIGAEGMGLFQIVFPILGLVLTLVTAGLPLAISKLVAEAVAQNDKARVKRIMGVSVGVVSVMTVILTILMYTCRGFIEHHWLSDSRAFPTYLAMIPLVSIIAISSLYRGYFQGLQDMSPTAWGQILEQTVRIISIWILAAYFIQFSLEYAAAAAMMGMVLGEFCGMLFLVASQRRRGRLDSVLPNGATRSHETVRQTLHAMGEIALPVTLSKLIWSVLFAAEPILVMRALKAAGFTTSTATALYGQYSGMAIPLLVFPTVFTGSLATNLVPSVSEAIAASERFRVRIRLSQSFTATAMVAFPSAVVLTMFAAPLTHYIYKEDSIGPILAVMAPFMFLLCLQAPLTGILQGLNKAGVAMVNSIIGGVLKLLLIYFLASKPTMGILGVSMATAASFTVSCLLNLWFVVRYVGFTIRLHALTRVALASCGMFAYMQVITWHRTPLPFGSMMLAILGGFILYFGLLCALRVLTTRNIRRVPRVGPWLARLVARMPFAV